MDINTEIISSKLCGHCNEVNRFKIVNGRLSGRKCIKCCSKANNLKLKERNYYKNYYIEHADVMKANDKLRYARNKARNLVSFTFDNGHSVQNATLVNGTFQTDDGSIIGNLPNNIITPTNTEA